MLTPINTTKNILRRASNSLFLLLLFCTPGFAGAQDTGGQKGLHERWISINTQTHTLDVLEGKQLLKRFHNVALGRNGYAPLRKRGDGKTPLGTFHIAWVNHKSRFNIFLGLDYPNKQQAEEAWRSKLIDFDTYYNIRRALVKGHIPPQNTALGGYIGIHGTGDTSERIHKYVNWTQGCVAMTNKQIKNLNRWIKIGMKVVISNDVVVAAQ